MKRTSFANWPCSVARTMDLLGDWWTPLVLREAFYGIRRFDEFQQELGIARTTLSERLRRLVEAELLEKQVYETMPVRYEYVLTESGRDFYGVLLAMTAWGDRWLSGRRVRPSSPGTRAVATTRRPRWCAHTVGSASNGRMSPRGPGPAIRRNSWRAPIFGAGSGWTIQRGRPNRIVRPAEYESGSDRQTSAVISMPTVPSLPRRSVLAPTTSRPCNP